MSTPYGLIHCASCSNWLLFVPYSRIRIVLLCVIASFLPLIGCNEWKSEQLSCLEVLMQGNVQQVAKIREQRFLGKIPSKRAHCLGGDHAVALNGTPWFDWPNYWAAGDKTSLSMDAPLLDIIFFNPNRRGIFGALYELELQRIELIKFNLFDNNGTYEAYIKGFNDKPGPTIQIWPEMQLPATHLHLARLKITRMESARES